MLYFNVSGALGLEPGDQDDRVETWLARAFLGKSQVEFVAVMGRELRLVSKQFASTLLDDSAMAVTPQETDFSPVQYFGTGRMPVLHQLVPSTVHRNGRLARARLRWQDGAAKTPEHRTQIHAVVPRFPLARPTSDDVLFSVGPDWRTNYLDIAERVSFISGCRIMAYVADVLALDSPEFCTTVDQCTYFRYLDRLCRMASVVACPSEFTRRRFVYHQPGFDPRFILTVGSGCTPPAVPSPTDRQLAESMFSGQPFAVYLSSLEGRKNHRLLYRVERREIESGGLANYLFVGDTGAGVGNLMHVLTHDRLAGRRFALLPSCGRGLRSAILQQASLCVYPSFSEGSTADVLEAAAHQLPCIVARGSALEEMPTHATVVHPLDTVGWGVAIRSALATAKLPDARPLPSWTDVADRLLVGSRQ